MEAGGYREPDRKAPGRGEAVGAGIFQPCQKKQMGKRPEQKFKHHQLPIRHTTVTPSRPVHSRCRQGKFGNNGFEACSRTWVIGVLVSTEQTVTGSCATAILFSARKRLSLGFSLDAWSSMGFGAISR